MVWGGEGAVWGGLELSPLSELMHHRAAAQRCLFLHYFKPVNVRAPLTFKCIHGLQPYPTFWHWCADVCVVSQFQSLIHSKQNPTKNNKKKDLDSE